MQADMVVSIRCETCPPAVQPRKPPPKKEALVHPAVDLVGEAAAGEAEPNGDLLFRTLLSPLPSRQPPGI
jgi:hypothetical protein